MGNDTRIIICGGRDFSDRNLCFETLDKILSFYENPEIISGHASGADSFGEDYAKDHHIPLSIFKAEWNKYGRGAGPIRNQKMLEYALEVNAVVIAFWDGSSRGTKNMIEKAENAGAAVHVINYLKQ